MSPRARWWAAAAGWMALIFCGSLAALSGDHTRHWLDWLARHVSWHFSYAVENRLNLLARKAAHLSEYAVLAALLHAALRRTVPGVARPGARIAVRAGIAAAAFALAVLYAQGDEYHQRFVPGRVSSGRDVEIDALGAALGLALTWRLPRGGRGLGEQPPE